MTAHSLDPELLVAQVDGLRALARSLVGDAHLAEDVVQDAMAAAIRRPPASGVPLGPWLVGVVRNLSRMTLRGRTRSDARDRAAGASRVVVSAEDAVARAEIHRLLVDALLALDEPYRATLILRYFDGREPTEIARATGVPAETVRTRVHRGLALLREKLRGDADDDAWRLAMLPLVRGTKSSPVATATITGGVLMTTTAKIVAAFAIGALVAVALSRFRDEPASAPSDVARAPSAHAAAQGVARRANEPRVGETPTEDAAKSADSHVPPAATDEERAKWPIRVTTDVPGATVTMEVRLVGGEPDPPPETKSTDARGFVGFEAPPKNVVVHRVEFIARAAGFTDAVAEAPKSNDGSGEVRISLRSGAAIQGVVHDAAGRPIAGAGLLVVETDGVTPPIVCLSPTARDGTFRWFADKSGRATLRFAHPAFLTREIVTDVPAADLVVVLDRGLEVSGRVAFPDGRPVPGVGIADASGVMRANTDADGRYVVSGLVRGPVALTCNVANETRTVEAGATNVDFVMKRSIARIRYVDERGRPFRFAATSVRVMKGDEVLEMSAGQGPADGLDLMDGPAGAQVLVSASSPDGRTGSGKATFDDVPRLHDVDVVLGAPLPTGTIRLVVRTETPDVPRAAFVDVSDEVRSVFAGGARKRFDLDAAGAVEIPNVPAGRMRVTVAAAAHWSAEALDTDLVAAKSDAEVEVGRTTEIVATLAVGGRVRAVVRDEHGVVVVPKLLRLADASAEIHAMFVRRRPDGGWISELDASPSVMIDAVPPGRYVVHAWMADGRDAEKQVDVVKGRTVDVEVTLKPTR